MPKKKELIGEAAEPVVEAPPAPPAIVCHLDANGTLTKVETLEREAWLKRFGAQDAGGDQVREVFLDQPTCDLEPGKYYWDLERQAFMPREVMQRRKEELDYATLDLECRVAELDMLEKLGTAAGIHLPKVCRIFRGHAQRSLERARSLARDV